MQSKLEVLTTRFNEVEEIISEIEDKLMVRKEAEVKREKQLRVHKEILREINDTLRRKNIYIIRIPEEAERERTKKYI